MAEEEVEASMAALLALLGSRPRAPLATSSTLLRLTLLRGTLSRAAMEQRSWPPTTEFSTVLACTPAMEMLSTAAPLSMGVAVALLL